MRGKSAQGGVVGCGNDLSARTHNLVLLVELLRQAAHSLPPDADAFGCLVPFAVVMRYEDALDDEPPHLAPE
jgi:hypothetical protein